MSFAIISRVTIALISTQIVSSVTTGTSCVPFTVRLISAEDDVRVPSLATKLKLSDPLKLVFGVYVNPLPLISTTHQVGSTDSVNESVSHGLRSRHENDELNGVSSMSDEYDAHVTRGGRLDPGITSSVTVPVFESHPL